MIQPWHELNIKSIIQLTEWCPGQWEIMLADGRKMLAHFKYACLTFTFPIFPTKQNEYSDEDIYTWEDTDQSSRAMETIEMLSHLIKVIEKLKKSDQ